MRNETPVQRERHRLPSTMAGHGREHSPAQTRSSPCSGQIAQLQSMVEQSPVVESQRKASESIGSSPCVTAQRQALQFQQRGASTAPQAVVQRKIGEEGNVIFGLSGRSVEAIQAAITAGYTTFDGADSYGDTIALLATAIKESGKARDKFEVIYKVDRTPPKDLESHLRTVAGVLGGYIDHVLIHKMTDAEQARQYSPILVLLKGQGLIRQVGGGDVQATMEKPFKEMESFEVDANDLFLAPDTDALIEKLNKSGKPVFVYNIVGTLKNLLGMDVEQVPAQSQLSAMVNKIHGLVPKAEPILSSRTAEKAAANLKIYEAEDETAAFEAYQQIEEGAKTQNPSVPVGEMAAGVKERVDAILFGGYDWGAERLFDTEKEYTETREKMLARFTAPELATRYQGEAKVFTLRQLIYMLFDSSGNCHRVEASNFLT